MTYELRPFQHEYVFGKGTRVTNNLLADEMGLGKTVEAIASDWEKRKAAGARLGKTLIIAPLSVVDVWVAHYKWMLPEMKVVAYDPTGKQPKQARDDFLDALKTGRGTIFVLHWDALRLMPELCKRSWFHVIADEAHRAKNRKAQQTIALKRIKAEHKTACTGTPAETRPNDLWSILNWLYPNKFTSYWKFFNSYVDWENSPQGFKLVKGVRNVKDLQKQIAPFYTRRLKEHVLKDLPEKQYTEIAVTLTPKQRKRYDEIKKDMLTWVGENEDKPIETTVMVAKLMRLQQFAISDCDIEVKWKRIMAKYKVKREHVTVGENVFDIKRRPIRVKEYRAWLEKKGYTEPEWLLTQQDDDLALQPINTVIQSEPSSKLDAVMQLIEDNPDESIVVFSQFRQTIELLGTRLAKAKISHGLYTGNTDKTDRDRIVREFQAGTCRVFAGTIRAGGEGITLTRSSTVVFIDRDWSPSKNKQAEDRVHRVGQKNAVNVIDIVARGTVDRGRLQKIDQSWKWIRQLLGDAA